MPRHLPKRNSDRQRTCRGIGAALLMLGSMSGAAYADESGVSYWLPGRFGSLAATPQEPGWSMAAVYYHTSVGRGRRSKTDPDRQIPVNRERQFQCQPERAGRSDTAQSPTYTFGTPVLGGLFMVALGAFTASLVDFAREVRIALSEFDHYA